MGLTGRRHLVPRKGNTRVYMHLCICMLGPSDRVEKFASPRL